jgi:UDP-glucose-4-epimerase GalE
MSTESQTVIVTGGSGFIGTLVCLSLVAAGHYVINIDRVKKEIPGVTQYPFDLSNPQVKGIIHLCRPRSIIHLAADHEVNRSTHSPGVFYHNNVSNTITLLNYAVDTGVENFVFSSSSSVYGNPTLYPTPETYPVAPQSPYARSKVIIESMLEDYRKAHGLNYSVLRYFNAAGAAPDLSHGYTQTPASHLIPILAKSIKQNSKVYVYGTDYPTLDGTAVRDYTHVADIADAHVLAMNYLISGGYSETINLGAGAGHSVLEVIDAFNEVTGKQISFQLADRRAGDVHTTCADNSKAERILGWVPKHNLEQIIEHAYKWETKRK